MSVALRLSVGDEASRRSALSRAYYCAYHVARRLIAKCGIRFVGTASTHEHLPWCLQNAGDANAMDAGRKLQSLRSERNNADYNLESLDFQSGHWTTTHIQLAQRIVMALEQIEPQSIAPAVRQYASTVLRLSLVDV
jgi:uncharacterized protein (UPF0332 family)